MRTYLTLMVAVILLAGCVVQPVRGGWRPSHYWDDRDYDRGVGYHHTYRW